MAKKCKRCGSLLVMNFMAKCPDGFYSEMEGNDYESPDVKGITSGECLTPSICLSCGQCQGKFPIKDLPKPVEEEIIPVPTAKTLEKFFDQIKEHDCGNKKMIACDDPIYMLIGEVCSNCGEYFSIRLSDCKKSDKKLIKKIDRSEKRAKFIDSLNFGK